MKRITASSAASAAFVVLGVLGACSDDLGAVPLLEAGAGDGGDADVCSEREVRCAGVCADLAIDDRNCGACGTACDAGRFCSAGRCRTCEEGGRVACGGECADVLRDPRHCGACGRACPDSAACSNGACVARCEGGRVSCGGSCIDIAGDPANCGGCGHACASGHSCSGGACRCSDPGRVACASECIDPETDEAHCGATAGCGSFAGFGGSRCATNGYCAKGTCRTCTSWKQGASIVLSDLGGRSPFLAIADFNGDAKLDIAVLKIATESVTIFLGRGDGTFAVGSSFPTGPSPAAIVTGDVDGNGKRDLVVGRTVRSLARADFLTVWSGNGDGTFTLGAVVEGVPIAERIAIGDLDEDGRDDLFVGGYSWANGYEARLALARPGGVFVVGDNRAPELETRFGSRYPAAAIVDADGDGHRDLVFVSYTALGGYFGNGDGTLGATWAVAGLSGAGDMVIGDANGDGRLDFFPRGYDRNWSAILGGVDGDARRWGSPSFLSWDTGPASQLFDVTGDGIPDLVGVSTAHPTMQSLRVRAGVGDGTFLAAESFPFAASASVDLRIADLNGDGRVDVIGSTYQGIQVLLGTPSTEPECQ